MNYLLATTNFKTSLTARLQADSFVGKGGWGVMLCMSLESLNKKSLNIQTRSLYNKQGPYIIVTEISI
jgi:hypothetical protein